MRASYPAQEGNVAAGERFDDFPYYNGKPVGLSGLQWLFVMLMAAIGFAALVAPVPIFARGPLQFVPAILFFAVPLLGLAIVTPKYWTAIFRKVRGRDVGWMAAFALLNLLVTLSVGFAVSKLFGTNPNPAVVGLADLSVSELVLFYLKTIPQLFGEEVVSILPFLALLTFFSARMNRGWSIVLAWLVSGAIFGALHLQTYDWNVAQCMLVIGGARLVLTLAYIKTKNIWVSTGAHIINDWTLFTVAMLQAGLQAPA